MFKIVKTSDKEFSLSGRLDAAEADNALPVFETINETVTLNCHDLAYVSSAGLGLLLATQIRLQKSGSGLRLTQLTPFVRNVLKFSGFDKMIEIVE